MLGAGGMRAAATAAAGAVARMVCRPQHSQALAAGAYTDSIMVLTGPQASTLHEHLYDSGYRGITAVHSNSELVQAWRQQHAANNKPTLNCQVAHIAEGLAFEHTPYNAIIDKGTLDSILCTEAGLQEAQAALLNVWNNLKSWGVFIMFTHGPPALRMPLVSSQAWSGVDVKVIVQAAASDPAPAASTSAAAAAKVPARAKAGGSAASGLQVVKVEADAVYPESATYVYLCKKPYV